MENRNAIIIRTSFIGIAVNLVLAAIKAAIGIITGSIAITLDAINNTSDALGSVITIIAAKLAGKQADRKHPFGYGRIEYLSTMVIAGLVLYAGISSLIESLQGILHPEASSYDMISIILLVLAVGAKVFLGTLFKSTGKRIDADSLVMSGQDALMDAVVSCLTIVAAGVYMFTQFSIEAYVGLIIAVLIIKAGLEMLRDTISSLLGEHGDLALAREVKKRLAKVDGVHGCYDLILHDYGPDEYVASCHVAVDDTTTAAQIDRITRQIMHIAEEEFHINMSSVGIYSINTRSAELSEAQSKVHSIIMADPDVMSMHGFYFDREDKYMALDVIVSFNSADRVKVFEERKAELQKAFPEFTISMQLDLDMSE